MGWEPTEAQFDIADWMQNLPRGEDTVHRGQIRAQRGEGKSELAACLVTWFLFLDPSLKILVIGSKEEKAEKIVRQARALIGHSPLMEHLVPRQSDAGKHKAQADSNLQFDVAAAVFTGKEKSCKGVGIFGGYTGDHTDVIIVDDCEIPENSLTPLNRERLMRKLTELEHIRNPSGYVLVMGTPQTEESVYFKMEYRGYPSRVWPGEYTDDPHLSPVFKERLQAGNVRLGDPLDPIRFDRAALDGKKSRMGLQDYALQVLLSPSLANADRYPLKLRNLIILDVPPTIGPVEVIWGTTNPRRDIECAGLPGDVLHGPVVVGEEYKAYQDGVLYIDPSGRGADMTAFAVAKLLHGYVFVPEVMGIPGVGHADTVMQEIARAVNEHQIRRVVVESNFGDGMFESLLAPVLARQCGPIAIESVKVTRQKELRIIDVLQPLTAQHRLVISSGAVKLKSNLLPSHQFQRQFSRITREKDSLDHDDLVDALAGACAQFAEQAVQDPVEVMEKEQEREKIRVAEEFRQAYIRQHGHPQWIEGGPKKEPVRLAPARGTRFWGKPYGQKGKRSTWGRW
jgi:hypothetical protein